MTRALRHQPGKPPLAPLPTTAPAIEHRERCARTRGAAASAIIDRMANQARALIAARPSTLSEIRNATGGSYDQVKWVIRKLRRANEIELTDGKIWRPRPC